EVGDKESIADGPVEKQHISIREIAAQCTVFFLAGYETTSSTLTFTLYLLAKHPEVQDKVVEEMREALDKHGGEIEYDTLLNLPYTDMVLNETMRLYPSVPFLNREAMRERKLPLTDLVLDKGTRIMIPIRALHMDPKYWDDPEEFKPERFTKDKMEARHPMVYLPFGDGPRICIGMRMGLIQMKMTLMTILTRAEVRLPADAPSTIKLSPLTVGPTPIDPLKLVFTERA
ncbi:Cytochrome P450 CYP6, partial [Frankliniella occidentalis]